MEVQPIQIPAIANRPLTATEGSGRHGQLLLRRNLPLDLIENHLFDERLIDYDSDYQNSQAYSAEFAKHMESTYGLLRGWFPKGSRLVEVGCGKGDFLRIVEEDRHFDFAGFDATYEGTSSQIEKRYLTEADRIRADVIVLRHVLEHVPRPHLFLAMLAEIFGSTPIYIEVPSFDWIDQNGAFFDITYEHVNYFSKRSLRKLFGPNVRYQGTSFGSQYQFVLADLDQLDPTYETVYNQSPWELLDFRMLFPELEASIRRITTHASPKKRVFIWGAATKGCMFLVHCVGETEFMDKLAYAIDLNPGKIGKNLPGSNLPIRSRMDFFATARDDDLLIVSNPNYLAEISADVRDHGLSLEILSL